MRGEDIKNKVISIIVKFYEIAGGKKDRLEISQKEFSVFSNPETLSTLESLEQEGLIDIVDITVLKDDINSQLAKFPPFSETSILIDIKDAFKEYIENMPFFDDLDGSQPIYEVRRQGNKREVLINNFILSKPDLDSENDRFIECVLANPNKKITVKEFEEFSGKKMKKKFERMVLDLGFSGVLKDLFFLTSSKAVKFINPVTRKHLADSGIKYLNFSEILANKNKEKKKK